MLDKMPGPLSRPATKRVPKLFSAADRHVAARLKAARNAIGLSQEDVGDHLGISFQQVQKYEKAQNRISAGKLFLLARLYGKPVQWFFDGLPDPHDAPAKAQPDIVADLLGTLYGAELAKAYLAIPGNIQRRAVVDVALAVAGKL